MLTLEYDGTEMCGWQSQAGKCAQKSTQEALEEALSRVLDEPVTVTGAGRTDAGVHATGQVAHLTTENPLECEKILRGANAFIRAAVAVREVREVSPEFDARRSATSRLYIYRVWNHPAPSPLRARTWLHVPQPLDHEAMAEAAMRFEGEHDFSAFRSSQCSAPNPVRTIHTCRWEAEGPACSLTVLGQAFLHSQVRIMVGTLLEVGRGKLSPEDLDRAFESGDRNQAGATAPAHGLTLERITYPEKLMTPNP